MKPNEKPAQKAGTKSQGITWVSSTGVYYTDPEIDVKKIKDSRLNIYGDDVTQKLLALVFMERPMIEVFGPDGEPDQDLSRRVTTMCAQPSVRMYSRMRQAFDDLCWWGPNILNDVWDWVPGDNGLEYWLVKLKRLPPESFAEPPDDQQYIYSHILQGITLDESGKTQYWHTDPAVNSGMPFLLDPDGITMITDPATGELAGRPMFLPLIPLIGMLGFSWNAQMQKVNKVASKPIFIKITAASSEDVIFAQKILNNWNKDQQFQIPENFEIIELTVGESDSAMETIDHLWQLVLSTITPTSMLGKDGSLISGSSEAQLELLLSFIRGKQEILCEGYGQLLQKYLDANMFTGYTVSVYIPSPSIGKSTLWLEQAKAGREAGMITVNEFRDRLELTELDEDGKTELMAEWIEQRRKVRAEWMKMVMESNAMDPFWLFSPDEARALLEMAGPAPELVKRPAAGIPEPEEEDQIE